MFKRKENDNPRVPAGQRLTRGWPVLHASPVPAFNSSAWKFRLWGECNNQVEWSWDQFRALPTVTVHSDFHCVTGWTKLDNTWEGVSFKEVAAHARVTPEAKFALIYAPYGYTANVPLEVLMDDDVLFAWSHDGVTLEPDHGYPLRLIVPKRYAWKSVKWVNGVQFLKQDVRGYWEERGYHNEAEPFAEQRYAWQEE
ncbi:MAG: sulfite oxidase-like oxidoreductase [Actinomycetota bacterium]